MLNTYLAETERLLQNPQAPQSLYSSSDLTTYINTARGQLAGEGKCIIVRPTMTVTSAVNLYPFSAINVTGTSGVQDIFNIAAIQVGVTGGLQYLHTWSWPWFNRYFLSQVNIPNAIPTDWAQYSPGINGSFYVYPTPDQTYTLTLDTICNPITLASDSDPEAIPPLWTDAVPYFAAYLALLSAQSQARQADANRMYERYEEFVARARRAATTDVLPANYPQTPDMFPPASAQKSAGKGGT